MFPPYRPRSTTGKQPRHKSESSTVKIESPIKIESASQPSSNVPTAGQSITRPNSLGSTVSPIKPNYQSALVNQYDPYKSDSSSNPSVTYKKSSPYFDTAEHFLFYIELSISHLKNLISLVKSYFDPNSHYLPGKPLAFYLNLSHYLLNQSMTQKTHLKYYTIPFT